MKYFHVPEFIIIEVVVNTQVVVNSLMFSLSEFNSFNPSSFKENHSIFVLHFSPQIFHSKEVFNSVELDGIDYCRPDFRKLQNDSRKHSCHNHKTIKCKIMNLKNQIGLTPGNKKIRQGNIFYAVLSEIYFTIRKPKEKKILNFRYSRYNEKIKSICSEFVIKNCSSKSLVSSIVFLFTDFELNSLCCGDSTATDTTQPRETGGQREQGWALLYGKQPRHF